MCIKKIDKNLWRLNPYLKNEQDLKHALFSSVVLGFLTAINSIMVHNEDTCEIVILTMCSIKHNQQYIWCTR
jgi:hypothetical protein